MTPSIHTERINISHFIRCRLLMTIRSTNSHRAALGRVVRPPSDATLRDHTKKILLWFALICHNTCNLECSMKKTASGSKTRLGSILHAEGIITDDDDTEPLRKEHYEMRKLSTHHRLTLEENPRSARSIICKSSVKSAPPSGREPSTTSLTDLRAVR